MTFEKFLWILRNQCRITPASLSKSEIRMCFDYVDADRCGAPLSWCTLFVLYLFALRRCFQCRVLLLLHLCRCLSIVRMPTCCRP